VESAAASPPAATSPMTQSGSWAISGLASTMMSLSMVSSLATGSPAPSTRLGPEYWMTPSPFTSSNWISPVSSQVVNHAGTSS
jgi:hypothetical protein